MRSVQELHDELDYWVFIGIGDDIVRAQAHRKEYQHLVRALQKKDVPDSDIPKLALKRLKLELKSKPFFRPTLYWLIWLEVKRLFS